MPASGLPASAAQPPRCHRERNALLRGAGDVSQDFRLDVREHGRRRRGKRPVRAGHEASRRDDGRLGAPRAQGQVRADVSGRDPLPRPDHRVRPDHLRRAGLLPDVRGLRRAAPAAHAHPGRHQQFHPGVLVHRPARGRLPRRGVHQMAQDRTRHLPVRPFRPQDARLRRADPEGLHRALQPAVRADAHQRRADPRCAADRRPGHGQQGHRAVPHVRARRHRGRRYAELVA